MKKKISIVVPVFSEAKNIPILIDRLESVKQSMDSIEWDIYFIDDASVDDSFNVLVNFSKKNSFIKVIRFTKNFGKEMAMMAGIQHASNSDAIVILDADLQHPPELIKDLVGKWVEGFDVVATIRTSSQNESYLRKIGSSLFYWIIQQIGSVDLVSKTTDFRLYDKKVISELIKITENIKMLRATVDWMGFKTAYIEFSAPERVHGEAGYSIKKLWGLAVNSITSFSLFPLRVVGYLGLLIMILSGLLLAWILINYLIGSSFGYTPLAIMVTANTFFMGITLSSIGLVALYVGTIHTEVINRPNFIIDKKINL